MEGSKTTTWDHGSGTVYARGESRLLKLSGDSASTMALGSLFQSAMLLCAFFVSKTSLWDILHGDTREHQLSGLQGNGNKDLL